MLNLFRSKQLCASILKFETTYKIQHEHATVQNVNKIRPTIATVNTK